MWTFPGFLLSLRPSGDSPTDVDLVEAVRHHDRQAFRALFDRYHPALYRFLVRMGLADNVVEDILQDVFVGVWSGRARLDPRRSIRAYLYRACKNRAANHFRRSARFTDDLLAEPASDAPDQHERLEYELLHRRLEEAVSLLPERRRAVFELCFVNGLTYKEAAQVLEISPKTVENQMGHALKSIREFVTSYLE